MRARGRSNRSLAAGAGVAKSTVSNVVAGLRDTLTDKAARALARELGLPVDVLFPPVDVRDAARELRAAELASELELRIAGLGLSTASINSGGQAAANDGAAA